MSTASQPSTNRRAKIILGAFVAACLVLGLLSVGIFFIVRSSRQPTQAPEAEQVLSAQKTLPFQVLIPAFLPPIFRRDLVEIRNALTGPAGESMIQLVYPTRKGNQLVLTEWIAAEESQSAGKVLQCRCICRSPGQCEQSGIELMEGNIHIRIDLSVPNLLSPDQMQYVIDTLGPAANQQVYTTIDDVPVDFILPEAVEIPLNAEGVQEVTLVVTPQGYTPAHFSVRANTPVRLIFRQLGQVGCGNELIIEWGAGKASNLVLDTPSDTQILEFTPSEAGVFFFQCPHQIYRGAMTVED